MPLDFDALLSNPRFMSGLALLTQPRERRQGTSWFDPALRAAYGSAQYRNQMQEASALQQYRDLQQQQLQFQIEQSKAQQARQAQQDALQAQNRAQIEAAIAALPPEQQQAARLNPQAFASAMAGSMFQKPTQAPDPIRTYQAVHPEDTALSGFDTWNRANRASGAMQLPAQERPLLGEAASWVMPDGTAPNPMLTPTQVVGMGGRVRTRAEVVASEQGAKMDAKASAAQAQSAPAIQAYYGAVERLRASPSADTVAEVSQQRRRMAQVLAQARNPGRAPTDADVNLALQDVPDPFSVGQVAGSALGGDPFMARMKVIEQELGVQSPTSVPADGSWRDMGNGVRMRLKP
ncbi:MAG TPA: hypothetical protein PJ986_14785 [Gammaproteobacteria bacterium]|nr:hypothetical protein [Gammaproteobacteria bacterium]